MILDLTISQLDLGPMPPERARELGQLGFLQWLGALPAMADYRREALRAHAAALPFAGRSPAVAAFCDLVEASTSAIEPLPFVVAARRRRGGARSRRAVL